MKSVGRTVVPGVGLVAILTSAVAAVSSTEADPVAAANVTGVLSASSAEEAPTAVSRDAERPPLVPEAQVEAEVKGSMYATDDLAVRADNSDKSPELATVDRGEKVDITGKTGKGFSQIVHKGATRWVATSGLSKEEPLGSQPCGKFSEKGLQPDAVKAMRAVCAKYPEISRIGTIAGRGEHATGHSLDIMLGTSLGNDVAAFLQENQSELGIEYLIWRQRIWRPATSGAWRGMSDRGSATANHMDHVHVTVYGNSASN